MELLREASSEDGIDRISNIECVESYAPIDASHRSRKTQRQGKSQSNNNNNVPALPLAWCGGGPSSVSSSASESLFFRPVRPAHTQPTSFVASSLPSRAFVALLHFTSLHFDFILPFAGIQKNVLTERPTRVRLAWPESIADRNVY